MEVAPPPPDVDGGEKEDARPSQVLWGKALDGKNLMPGQRAVQRDEKGKNV